MPVPDMPLEPTRTNDRSRDRQPGGDAALLQQQLEEQVRLLGFLYQLERELGSTRNIEEALARAIELARRTVGATDGGLVLLDDRRRVKVVAPAAEGRASEVSAQTIRGILGRSLSSWVAQHWEDLLVQDAQADPHWGDLPATRDDARSVIAVPLRFHGQFRGILTLTHRSPGHFAPTDLDLLKVMASRISTALAQADRGHSATPGRIRLHTTVVNLPDAVFAVDANGTVILANPTLGRLVERPASELLGHDFRQVIHLEHHSQPWPIEQVLRGRYASFDMDMVLRNAAGEEIPVRVSCGAIPGERGRPNGATVVLRDIRYLKEIEGLRQDLSNMLVHDLKGPLSSIASAVQLLQQYPVERMGKEILQELLSTTERSVVRLSRMVEAVLDVQGLETGQFPLTAKAVHLPEVVARVMADVSPLVVEAGIDTRIDLAGDLPAVAGDEDVLERVLWNLLDNALKYTPRGGLISVAGRTLLVPGEAGRLPTPKDLPAGRWVVVDVADSGMGIPAEERERIFGKFAQGRGGPLRRRGVGLGLAFCRLAVEAHGGRIWVESDQGQGSVFSFILPVAPLSAQGS